MYASGIYRREQPCDFRATDFVGLKAIKIIGWGQEKETPYWIAVNTWGTSWGERGTFKILRGNNTVGVESSIIAPHLINTRIAPEKDSALELP